MKQEASFVIIISFQLKLVIKERHVKFVIFLYYRNPKLNLHNMCAQINN